MIGRRNASGWASCVGIALAAITLVSFGACGKAEQTPEQPSVQADELAGTWFAYRDNAIENMWTFHRDGTCSNDGWPVSVLDTLHALPPYHLEGTYRVAAGRIEVVITLEDGATDTVFMREPGISSNRLVYSVGPSNEPVVFLRERAAVGQDMSGSVEEDGDDGADLSSQVIGDWVAFSNGFPANTWQFNEDGTFLNEGWARLDARAMLVKRLYQVSGRYTVSGRRVVLSNEKLLQFDPETNGVDTEIPLSERIVIYNVAISRDRLVYTNEMGLPVVFRRGTVTPTNW